MTLKWYWSQVVDYQEKVNISALLTTYNPAVLDVVTLLV